nr:hypothetical protein [Tanacetum cinerariifolium]
MESMDLNDNCEINVDHSGNSLKTNSNLFDALNTLGEGDSRGVPKTACAHEMPHGVETGIIDPLGRVSSGAKNKSPTGGGKKNLSFLTKSKIHYFDSDGTVIDDLDQEVETADYRNGGCSLSSSYDAFLFAHVTGWVRCLENCDNEKESEGKDDLVEEMENNTYVGVTVKKHTEYDKKLIDIPTQIDFNGNEVVVFDEILVAEGTKRWHGFGDIIDSNNGIYLTKFYNEEGLNFFVKNSPWMTTNGISALASRVGRPMIMDAMTATMCKVCVVRVCLMYALYAVFLGTQHKDVGKNNEEERTECSSKNEKVEKNRVEGNRSMADNEDFVQVQNRRNVGMVEKVKGLTMNLTHSLQSMGTTIKEILKLSLFHSLNFNPKGNMGKLCKAMVVKK